MRQNISEWNRFLETLQAVNDLVAFIRNLPYFDFQFDVPVLSRSF
jgi:hypothetical protein